MLLTVALACVQAQLPPDSVVPGDLNGQETDVAFIYSLPCKALKDSAQQAEAAASGPLHFLPRGFAPAEKDLCH